MLAAEIAVFYTIAAAVLCWGLGEARRSRVFWTSGALLALIHSVAAFITFYGGSHHTARLETMRQTAALTGIEFSGGIYLNYLFLAVWLGDAAWWWIAPHTYRSRPRAVSFALRGFIVFIIVNGAIVFADGWARVVGLVALIVAAAGTWRRHVAAADATSAI
jgi:hypothetical protein